MCEIVFLFLCGIAIMAYISLLVKSVVKSHSEYIITIGILAWIFMCGCFVWLLLKYRIRVQAICVALCFILSPLFPIFILNALRYQSYASAIGQVPTPSGKSLLQGDGRTNVYLFIFDEWSYQRSFKDGELIFLFPHLQQFADQAIAFHSAQAPSSNTDTALPSILCQTRLPFTVRGTQLGFRGREFHPVDRAENIFYHAQELGFFTAIIGSGMPFGEMLGTSLDFYRSIPGYKWFGSSFFGVAKYHLLTAALLLPSPLFRQERTLLAHYFFNQFQVYCIDNTHELFTQVIRDQILPTFAVFHYMIPHFPYIFTPDGRHKKFLAVYESNDPSNYYDSLAHLDKKIGEIITTLKETNKFDKSLIIFTTDHGWRNDPGYDKNEWWRWGIKKRHVPLFIKLPFQKHSIEIDTIFETYHLGNFINKYLNGKLDLSEAERLFRQENCFKPRPLEADIPQEAGR
jgi:hypothetical protein